MTKHVVCTLFEGNYDVGAATLLNSLYRAGFEGTLVCGHRGRRPWWAGEAHKVAPVNVRFVEMDHPHHLTYQKARIMLRCIEDFGDDIESIFYVDPDIVVKSPWSLIRRWAADGVALVQDVNGDLPARHPTRLLWRDWMLAKGIPVERELDRYYNAGFIGLPPRLASVLHRWQEMIMLVESHLGALTTMKAQTVDGLFSTGDQDSLNMVLEGCTVAINGAGPEAMDFIHGGSFLSHAIGTPKPWQGSPIRQALDGRPPTISHRAALQFMDGPLPALPPSQLRRLRVETRVAQLVGRVYRRA